MGSGAWAEDSVGDCQTTYALGPSSAPLVAGSETFDTKRRFDALQYCSAHDCTPYTDALKFAEFLAC